ncbi:MAG TPA: YbaL family putative K(+) efflux transporter [Solirubrobacteraceae bacterium]|nr:YbaL family putative K(+) efflux transporter [Solirubrobacteraceae bacterium]
MQHETALIAILATGLGFAFVFGVLAVRLGLPPLVGYLVAGVLVGPFTPGFVADPALASQLAEIGVILLMFGVGLHFSPRDLMAVRGIAVPGAVFQIGAATALGAAVAHLWGWSWGSGIVFGLCLSVASTVVLLRALEDRGALDSGEGKIAVGWLIVEDLFTVLVLVLLPALAGLLGGTAAAGASAGLAGAIGVTLAKVAAFLGLMFVVGRRVVPWLLERVAHTGSRELFTLAVLATALGVAVGAAVLFGVSFALGAFFAGVVISESDLSHRAAADALPLQDAFAVLFFVAVGMLFDPTILVRRPLQVLLVVFIVMIGKSIAALAIVRAFGHPLHTSLTISASLAQIGEFSFILAALGVSLGLLPPEGQSLIVAGALLSITLNALVFKLIAPVENWVQARPRLARLLERSPGRAPAIPADFDAGRLRDHAIHVGHGRVGRRVAEALAARGIPYLVIEQDRGTALALREQGLPVISGDAAHHGVLEHAGLRDARLLVVTAPEPFQARAIIDIARRIRPAIDIAVRTHSDAEHAYLERSKVGMVVMGEQELADAMARYALGRFGAAP